MMFTGLLVRNRCAMLTLMNRHRNRYDALKAVDRATWLVVRDEHSMLLAAIELAPNVDPVEVLAGAMEHLEAQGLTVEEPPSHKFAGFFCRLDRTRVLVSIAHKHPLGPDGVARPSISEWAVDAVSQIRLIDTGGDGDT